MRISKSHLRTILNKLEDLYPLPLEAEDYAGLAAAVGDEMTLDGHLLYLQEKGFIHTSMNYHVAQRAWRINSQETRISADGLDYLEDERSM
ncbi:MULTISPECIES: hypothetical protein [Atlantibacter]|mgnify:FL=1|uniref:DUF2513 domain-containing protein n=2 Tax=Atlantibacter hermannii TaxID=565 RepID=H5V2B0_ATLHE|nr:MULTISPECIES: hypothetical protein [Atlantibacter]EBW6088389.1 hypothetical protein [Salmonella enterica subsp. enterica serovar Enteritidis]MCQ4967471.1 hypothetical protein [Enterobacteriaceae bacterium DFI.7.85]HAI51442.1 hypothetical protein [Enterobacteriaceae bacterium]KIU35656.1 hypothetical protein SR38_00160 [Atlantibacter hermannii]MBW9431660.1 hypothetical protein [Atlantibacter hermannii]